MRSNLYRIRFVGGLWHNRLVICLLLPSVTIGYRPGEEQANPRYSLAKYRTKAGTPYYQYVHSSLIENGQAAECTWRERFPKWKISRHEMKRLRAFQ